MVRPMQALLTLREAAGVCRIHPRTFLALLARKALPAVHIGRRRLIRQESLEQFIREHETGGRA